MNSTIIGLSLYFIRGNSPIFASEPIFLSKSRISLSYSPVTRGIVTILFHDVQANYFLSPVVILEKASYICQTICSQVVPTTGSSFTNCLFANVSVLSSQGSAIECTSAVTLQMKYCRFYNCCATSHPSAGAILSNGPIFISKCCFERCYKNYEGDNYFTNTIYCTGASFQVNYSSVLLSAPSNTQGGDSTFYLNSCLTTLRTDNFTNCFGCEGGASARLDYAPTGSTFSLINVIASGQYAAFENVYSASSVALSYWNVVNNTAFYCAWINFDTGVGGSLSNCVFIGNTVPSCTFLMSNGASCNYSNCVSDYSTSYVTYIAKPTTNDIGVGLGLECFRSSSAFSSVMRSFFCPIAVFSLPFFELLD